MVRRVELLLADPARECSRRRLRETGVSSVGTFWIHLMCVVPGIPFFFSPKNLVAAQKIYITCPKIYKVVLQEKNWFIFYIQVMIVQSYRYQIKTC